VIMLFPSTGNQLRLAHVRSASLKSRAEVGCNNKNCLKIFWRVRTYASAPARRTYT